MWCTGRVKKEDTCTYFVNYTEPRHGGTKNHLSTKSKTGDISGEMTAAENSGFQSAYVSRVVILFVDDGPEQMAPNLVSFPASNKGTGIPTSEVRSCPGGRKE